MFALCFSKLNISLVALCEGKGVWGVSNGEGEGQGVRRGGQVSHSCTILMLLTLLLFVFRFSSRTEDRGRGLNKAQGRRSEGKF